MTERRVEQAEAGPQPSQGPGASLKRAVGGGLAMRLGLIGLLCALAQVPLWSVEDLVRERTSGRNEAVAEVVRGWGGSRFFNLPYLELPVRVTQDVGGTPQSVWRYFGLVAERADITLDLDPELRRRGLFDVVVHRSVFDFGGDFAVPDTAAIAAAFGAAASDIVVDWQHARLVLDIEAPQALEGEVLVTQGETTQAMAPQQEQSGLTGPGSALRLTAPVIVRPGHPARVSLALAARGSGNTMIVPGAMQTDVLMTSSWPSPSFLGARLPVQRDVGDDGFGARWSQAGSLLGLAPWSITTAPGTTQAARSAAFGVRLIEPVDTYRMVERAVKYGMLFVVTTFFVYVMFEVTGGVAVHIVHYGLVGLALCLFYLLLLSLAEVWGFAAAYLASVLAVLAQTGLFTRAVAGGWKRMATFVAVLGGCYAWLYVLLDMQELALLGGALGLFVLLSVAMYVLRRLGGPMRTATGTGRQ